MQLNAGRAAAGTALDEPGEGLTARLVHHGSRLLLLLAAAVAIYLFFPGPRVPEAAVLEPGVVAPRDVIAGFSFPVPKPQTELMREQAEAASGVSPTFRLSPATADTVVAGIRAFFATVDTLAANPAGDAAVRAFLERNRVYPPPGALPLLLEPRQRRTLRLGSERAVRELLPRGVLPFALGDAVAAVRVAGADGEQLVPRDSLIAPDRFFSLAGESLPEGIGGDGLELQRLILIRFFRPSLQYDETATEAARARARAAVDPVQAVVLEGEKIVGAHEQVGETEAEKLRAYQLALPAYASTQGGIRWGLSAGAVLYNLLVLVILGVVLLLFRPALYAHFRSVVLLALLVVAVTGAAALLARLELPAELIPVTFAALIVSVLWDGRLGLIFALLLALLMGGQSPYLGISAPFTIALGGAAAAFSVQVVQRRSRTWHFISIISIAYVAAAIALGLLRSRGLEEVLESMAWGAGNAIVASLLAIGFLPLLESFTRITTDQTLLELSDLNRKLLKKLSFEASGTYHHTINVANLAEAACHAIGAHGLLARVGAYYHDIGKLAKPQYFIENQPKGRNPHDKLKPATSAAMIRNHVTEGLKMSREAGLPDIVRDFIAEHHGTQRISFFYDKAQELDPEGEVNVADFTYPGPRPRTRETAVVMMADSVESASRVLQDPSPARLRELVDRIVSTKIAAGQLDDAPLTLQEIIVVKQQLVNVLAGMYHQRIDYPPQAAAPEPLSTAEAVAVSGAATAG